MKTALVTLLAVAALGSAPVAAQPREPGGVSVGAETTRDRFHYRFENPSSFDTDALVPHEFSQTYWGDNQWLVVRAAFNAGTHLLETEFGTTPQKATRGDDVDTFFHPSGDIATSGTTGNVSLWSWRARQTLGLGRAAGLEWNVSYLYRRDRSIFGPGLKTVSHTLPSSIDTSIISTRETTISQTYGLQVGVSRRWGTGAWRTSLGVDVAPAMSARLTTLLPDKYPGRTIVFSALVASVSPHLRVTCGTRRPISVTAGYSRTLNYSHANQFFRNAATVGISVDIS